MRGSDERGVAVVIAMMALLLMTALGTALVLETASGTVVAANYRSGSEAVYAADAVVERAIDDLVTVADWNQLLNGSIASTFVDGAPSGTRRIDGGSIVDLEAVVNTANCGKPSPCSPSEIIGNASGDRPWSANNPVWQLYGYGPLAKLISGTTIDSPFYVVLMVADDPSENDGLPLQDGQLKENPGRGVIALRAEAFGPRGAHKAIEVCVARADITEVEREGAPDGSSVDAVRSIALIGDPVVPDHGPGRAGVRILSWREVR